MIFEKIESAIRHRHLNDCLSYFENPAFIGSYPKSGNTWFRFLSSSILRLSKEPYKSELPINFHDVIFYAPETPFLISEKDLRAISSIAEELPVFLKTHFYCNARLRVAPGVILFRNPLDALKSYYRYTCEELGKNVPSFESFLRKPRFGVDYWNLFHETWLKNDSVIFLDFDQFRSDPERHLIQIYRKFKVELDAGIVSKAVEMCSVTNMSSVESEFGDPRKVNARYRFIKKSDQHIRSIEVDNCSENLLRKSDCYGIYEKCKVRYESVFGSY